MLLQILGSHIAHIACQMSGGGAKGVCPHLRISDHHPRDRKQSILPRLFLKRLFVWLQGHQVKLADLRDGFDRNKGILLYPGRSQAVLDRLWIGIQKLG